MTEPTRDALHAETLAFLEREAGEHARYPQYYKKFAYAAECVKRVPELEAEVRELSDALAEITSLNLSSEKGRGWSADAKMQGASVELWVASLVDLFKAQGGPNYVEASVRDVRDGATYFVIIGPHSAKSPHTIRRELEAEVERLRAKAAIVDAMDSGAIDCTDYAPNRIGILLRDGKRWFHGPTLCAAYAAATREGTSKDCGGSAK